MKRLGIWPDFERGERFGDRYVKVNEILLQLRDALELDLWSLDAVWWYLEQDQPARPDEPGVPADDPETDTPGTAQQFGLERHLHEFMRDNWAQLELAADWMLYQEPGDEEAGYEYPCDVGRIDLLAKHRSKPTWLVIELKRNQTGDQTVGQLLRYMGWVEQHLAEEGDHVCGMIVCRQADNAIRYAVSALKNVELRLYEVSFRLTSCNRLESIKQ